MSEIRHDDKDPAQKPASNDTLFFRDKSATINDATDGIEVTTASGIVQRGLEDNEAEVVTAFTNQVPQVTPAERTAGTETSVRQFAPSDISSMIIQHETGGGGSITEAQLHDLISGLDLSSIESTDEFLFRVASGTDELAVTYASSIVNKGNDDLGISAQNLVSTNTNPTADDDGAGTLGIVHQINDLWTNTATSSAYICVDNTTNNAVWSSITSAAGGGVTDHGALTGLADDDHSQYLLTDGTRALTGDQDFNANIATNYGPNSDDLSGVSTAEITAGTSTEYRVWSPADVSAAVIAHETGGGGGSITESDLHDLISGLDASSVQSNDEFLLRVSSGTDELAVTTASGIVDRGLTDLGIDPQNRISVTRDPNANDDGAGTNGVIHIINDLWTNTDTDEAFICLDITTSAAVWSSITAAAGGGVTDHGALTGLSDDDHTQYLLTTGARTLTGNQDFGGNVADNYGPLSSTLSAVSTAEITAGTSTEYRVWSPADVSAAVIAHETGGGGGSLTESELHDVISALDASSVQSTDEFLFRVASGTDELAVITASGIVDKGLTDLGIDPQNRITDTRDPNANDDGAGTNGVIHIVNDLWTNTSSLEAFICLDITTSAAVWSSITAAGGGGGGTAWSDPVDANIVPDTDITYNLGSAAARFDTAYVSSLSVVSSNLEASATFMDRIGDSTYFTIQHAQDIFHSTGHTTGGTIVSGSTTGVDVSAGTGLIRAVNDDTDPLLWFDWSASAGVPVPSDTTRYIGIEYNGGSPQVAVKTTYDWNLQTEFPLGIAVNEGGELYIENAPHKVGDHAGLMIERLYATMPLRRDVRISPGLILGEIGTRNVTMTAGAVWDRLNKFSLAAIDTSVADTFDRYYTDGVGGWNKQAAQTQWDNTQYDNAGTLTTVTTNRYSNQYFYVTVNDKLVSIYGQAQYTSLAAAEAESPPSTVPDRLKEGLLIGRIVFQANGATAESVESAFTTTFAGAQVTDHGSLAGLSDDDHSQYLLTTGARTLTGNQDFGGNVADNYGPLSSTLSAVSTDEISAGTSTEYRVYSPADVSAMIAQHAPVPELYVIVPDENSLPAYVDPTAAFPQRFGTNADWCGFKVNLTEYDEFQVRATYESGDNSGIVLGVACTSGSTPLNRTSPAFSIGDGQGEPYEYIHSGQLGADAVVSGGASFDGASARDYAEGAWTPLDPSVKRECGIAFVYLDGSGTTAGNRNWSKVHVAFRRNR